MSSDVTNETRIVRIPATQQAFGLEALEARVLLSVSIDAVGVMTVMGTDGPDRIAVRPGGEAGVVVVRSSIDGDSGEYTGVRELVVDGGDGDDKIKVRGLLLSADGEPLPVTLVGAGGDDRIVGGAGGEDLLGGTGDDRINGRGGDDTIIGGSGVDRLNGRRGFDRVSYEDSPAGVVVDLGAGVALDDGHGDEDRRVRGFELLVGSAFADRLAGSKKTDVALDGGGGADLLSKPMRGRGGRAETVVVGRVSDGSGYARLVAVPEDGPIDEGLDLTGLLDGEGRFAIGQEQIESLLGVSLKKGETYKLRLEAEDPAGNETQVSLPITKGVAYEFFFAGAVDGGPAGADTPTPRQPLPDGEYNVTATATDVAGNVSDPSNTETVVVDTGGPSIEAAVVDVPVPGRVGSAGSVSVADLSTFALNFGTTPGFGSWELGDFNGDGSVTVEDLSLLALNFGFIGLSSRGLSIANVLSMTVDLQLSTKSDSGLSDNDGITNDTTPTVTIQVRDLALVGDEDYVIDIFHNDVVVGSMPLADKVSWTFDPLVDGNHAVAVSFRNVSSGDQVGPFGNLTFTVDTLAPAPPLVRIATESDSGRSDSDGITNVVAPKFVLDGDDDSFITVSTKRIGLVDEPGPPGTIVEFELFDPDAQETVVPVSLQHPGTHSVSGAHTFDDGIYHATAEASDLAGNIAVAEGPYRFVIDTTAPWAPILDLLASSDSGFSDSDNITNDTTPSFSVIAQLDSDVQVFVDGELFAETGPTETDSSVVTLGV